MINRISQRVGNEFADMQSLNFTDVVKLTSPDGEKNGSNEKN